MAQPIDAAGHAAGRDLEQDQAEEMEDVTMFLASLQLSQYAEAFEKAGFDDLALLRAIAGDAADLQLLTAATGLKPGHAIKLRRALLSAVTSPQQQSPPQPPRKQQHVQPPDTPTLTAGEPPERGGASGGAGTASVPVLHAAELELDETCIGSGSYGEVFRGRWRCSDVAVKRLRPLWAAQVVMQELQTMASVGRHANVVALLGTCTLEGQLCIVTEFMDKGSLLHVVQTSSLALEQLLSIAVQAAAGVSHLHAEGVVHRDIACRNFLVDSKLSVRVTDFGLARLLQRADGGQTASNLGPIRWMAPESLERMQYSYKSDVYMFGVTMFEMFTRGAEPWGTIPLSLIAHNVCIKRQSVMSSDAAATIPSGVAAIIRHCCAHDPGSRPMLRDVVEDLMQLIAEVRGATKVVYDEFKDSTESAEDLTMVTTAPPLHLMAAKSIVHALPASTSGWPVLLRDDVVCKVLLYLDMESLRAALCVCQSWNLGGLHLLTRAAPDETPLDAVPVPKRPLTILYGRRVGLGCNRFEHVEAQHTHAVQAVQMVGDLCVSAGEDRQVIVANMLTGEVIDAAKRHTYAVRDLKVYGNQLVTCGNDKRVKLWTLSPLEKVYTWHEHTEFVRTVDLDGASGRIASGSECIKIWRIDRPKSEATFGGEFGDCKQLCFLGNGYELVTASRDKGIRRWDLRVGYSPVATYNSHTKQVWSLSVDPVGFTTGVSCGLETTIHCWDLRFLGDPMRLVPTKAAGMDCCVYDRVLCSGINNSTVHIWDVATGRHWWSMKMKRHPIPGVKTRLAAEMAECGGACVHRIQFDGSRMLCGLEDGSVRAWEFADIKLQT